MDALIVLASISVLWLIASRRWRYRIILPMAIVILICFGFTMPFTVELALNGFVAALPKDTGEPVDAIVILGRGLPLRHQRVKVATQQWQTGRSPKIFASGQTDATPMLEALKIQGIPVQALAGESCSMSTEENGLFTSLVLNPQQNQKILLITDAPHMLRSLLTFRRFGYTPIPQVSPLVPTWGAKEKSKVMMREVLGIIGYGITGRLSSLTKTEASRSHTNAVQRVKEWNCKVQVRSL
jgi:uncharacterized SAM-binding protein YcdF (DUF218 family)